MSMNEAMRRSFAVTANGLDEQPTWALQQAAREMGAVPEYQGRTLTHAQPVASERLEHIPLIRSPVSTVNFKKITPEEIRRRRAENLRAKGYKEGEFDATRRDGGIPTLRASGTLTALTPVRPR